MRSVSFLLIGLAAFAQAQPTEAAFGTKPDLVLPQSASAPVGAWELAQLLIALGLVAMLLAWGLPALLKRVQGNWNRGTEVGTKVEMVGTAGAATLFVVVVRGRTLLLGVTPQSVSTLADLTQDEAALRREPAFFEMMDQAAKAEPRDARLGNARAVVDDRGTVVDELKRRIEDRGHSPEEANAREMLQRLRRLVK